MARSGMVTASKFAIALKPDRSGTGIGKVAEAYALEVASERMGDEEEGYSTGAMRRGSLLEPEAIEAYQDQRFNTVEQQHIVFHESLPVCGTPDGFVREDGRRGIIECKARTAAKHAHYMIHQQPTEEDLYQIQGNLWLSGADFCHFISYRPKLFKEKDRLLVIPVQRDEAMIEDIATRLPVFCALVDSYAERLGVTNWKPYHLTV